MLRLICKAGAAESKTVFFISNRDVDESFF